MGVVSKPKVECPGRLPRTKPSRAPVWTHVDATTGTTLPEIPEEEECFCTEEEPCVPTADSDAPSYPATAQSFYLPKSPTQKLIIWIVQNCNRFTGSGKGPEKVSNLPMQSMEIGQYSKDFDHDLHKAIQENDWKTARTRLVNFNANPNQSHGPARNTAIQLAAVYNAVEIIAELVSAGGDVHATCIFGNEPLIAATMFGNPEAIRELTAFGADPNKTVKVPWFLNFFGSRIQGCTPIFLASSFFEHAPTAKMLLDCGADPYIKNAAGQNAFDVAGREISAILARWKRNNPHKGSTELVE